MRVLSRFLPAMGLLLPSLALAQAPDPAGTAKKALDLFLGGKYAELNQMFAPSTKDSYTETALSKLAVQLKSFGDLQKVGQPSPRDMGPVSVVTIPVEFAKDNRDFIFPVNADGKIVQMYMRPGQAPWQRPDYVKAAAFQTREGDRRGRRMEAARHADHPHRQGVCVSRRRTSCPTPARAIAMPHSTPLRYFAISPKASPRAASPCCAMKNAHANMRRKCAKELTRSWTMRRPTTQLRP